MALPPLTTAESSLLTAVEHLVDVQQINRPRLPPGWHALGPLDLILRYGSFYTPSELPPNIAKATPRRCFTNASWLHFLRPELVYVEGMALSAVPTWHAWTVGEQGQVVDPTWSDDDLSPPTERAYLGVPILPEIAQWYRQRSRCPVVDDWQARWPLCRMPVEEWLDASRLPRPVSSYRPSTV